MCSVLSPGHRSGKPDERPDPSPAGSDPAAWDQWPLAQRRAFQLACPLAKQPDAWRPTEQFQATPGRKHPLEGMLHYILLSKERITGVKTNTHNISVSKKKKKKKSNNNRKSTKTLKHKRCFSRRDHHATHAGATWVYLQQRLISLFIWNKHVSLSDPSNCWTNRALCLIRFWYIHIWKSKTYNWLVCKKLTVF